MFQFVFDLVTSVPTPSLSPSPATTGTGGGGGGPGTATPPWVPYLTLIAALLAAGVALVAALLQRKSGKESAAAARASAAAAKTSSEASQRSATAAERSVELNADAARTTATRLDSEALAKRFQDAASQLGNENAAVRLAGVYSMARLADDWRDQRQTCIEVLCAYLRISAAADEIANVKHDERQVQDAIISLIVEHLNTDVVSARPLTSWADNWIDISGIDVTNFSLSEAVVTAGFKMENAVFRGRTEIHSVTLPESAELSLAGCTVAGDMTMTLDEVEGELILDRLKVERGGEFSASIGIGLLADYPVYAKNVFVAGRARFSFFSAAYDERDTTYSVNMPHATVDKNGSLKLVIEPSDQPPIDLYVAEWTVGERANVELPANVQSYSPWEPHLVDLSARIEWN